MRTSAAAILLALAACGGPSAAPAEPATGEHGTPAPAAAPGTGPIRAGKAIINDLRRQQRLADERERTLDGLMAPPR